MSPQVLKKICSSLIWIGLSALTAFALISGALRDLEARTWDWRLQFIANPELHNSKIKIITIDQRSLDYFARHEKIYWPWPRSLYVPVVEFLKRAGAKGVAFDLLFTDDAGRVEEDAQLATALRGQMSVVQAFVPRSVEVEANEREQSEQALHNLSGRRAEIYLSATRGPRYSSARLPAPEILESGSALGSVVAEADNDTIFRRAMPGGWVGSAPFLSLPFALFESSRLSEDVVPAVMSYVDSEGKFLIRFHGAAGTYETYSIHSVINSWLQIEENKTPTIPVDDFKDAFVFVGATAPGLLDLRSVPLGGAFSGVEVNATILDNLLSRSFLRDASPMAVIVVLISVLGLVVLGAVSTTRVKVAIAMASPIMWIGACFIGAMLGWWIPMVIPTIALVSAVSLGFLVQYQIEGKQHRFVRGAFQHFVSADVVERIVRDPNLLALGGERREMTMFFADIDGFTTLSEKMEPSDLVRFINRLLSEVTEIIVRHEGTIDKYEGDAVIAFWNAPLANPDHRARAVEAAIACQVRIDELGDSFQADFGFKPRLRIGLNTGVVTVGNFGSSKRFNYTVIGDAVNLAARLEGTNKVFGTRILVSERTHEGLAERFTWRRVGVVMVKGKQRSTRIFEPLDPRLQERMIAALPIYEDSLAAFERGERAAAAERFAALDFDPVSRAYGARIESERGMSNENPLSAVWILTEK
jgi:adenylate cyclase